MTQKREVGIEAAPRRYKDIIDRQLVRDARLSLRALGLAVRLLSNTPSFKMTSLDLARERPEGRDAIRAALRELEAFGYLRRYVSRRPNGQWETRNVITDEVSPGPENPSSAPRPEKPAPGNPTVGASGRQSSKSTTSKSSTRKSTTTTDVCLVWPSALSAAQKVVVGKVISGMAQAAQQQLLDELAGALLGPKPPRQLASWMRALRARQQRGEFFPDQGLAIEKERIRQAAEVVRQQELDEERRRRSSPEARARNVAAYQRAIAELEEAFGKPSNESGR